MTLHLPSRGVLLREELLGREVPQGLVRQDRLGGVLPGPEQATQGGQLQGAPGDLIERLRLGSLHRPVALRGRGR